MNINLEQVETDLSVLSNLQEVLIPLDEDRQIAILESYQSDLQVYALRYGDESDQEQALESIGSLIKQGFDFIVGLIKKAINYIANFFGGGENKIPVTSTQIADKVEEDDDDRVEEVAKAKDATAKAKAVHNAPDIPKPSSSKKNDVRIEDTFAFGSVDFTYQGKKASAAKTLPALQKLGTNINIELKDLSDDYEQMFIGPIKKALKVIDSNKDADITRLGNELITALRASSRHVIDIKNDISLPNHIMVVENNVLKLDKQKDKGPRYYKDITPKLERKFLDIKIAPSNRKLLLETNAKAIQLVQVVMQEIQKTLKTLEKQSKDSVKPIPADFSKAVIRCSALIRLLKTNADVIDRVVRTFNKAAPAIYRKGLKK